MVNSLVKHAQEKSEVNKQNLEWVDNQKIKCRLNIWPEVEQDVLSIMVMTACHG